MRRSKQKARIFGVLAACLWVGMALSATVCAGCSDEPAADGPDQADGWTSWGDTGGSSWSSSGASSGGGAASSGGSGGGSSSGSKPPEKEVDLDLGVPAASENFVFVPVKGADHVVKVSGKDLSVALIEVGDRPTVMATVPGQDAALVINAGSDDVSLVRASDGGDVVTSLAMLPHCNALSIAPDGKQAIAWYDHSRNLTNEPVGAFQAVTVIHLQPDKGLAYDVSVGFGVRAVQFVGGGAQAMVITDDGVSVLDFDKLKPGAIVAAVALSTDPLDKGKGREVQVTPDGRWAVVRQAGLKGIVAVHLQSKVVATLQQGTEPTDVDVLPDSKAALVVNRASQAVTRVELPAEATKVLVAKTVKVPGFAAGLARVTSDGKTALLYSTVAGVETVAAMDLGTMHIQPTVIRKTIKAVFLPEGSRRALLVHRPADGPGHSDSTEAFVDDKHGYTFYDLDTGFTNLELTDAAATGFARVDEPARVYMLLPDPTNVAHKVQSADLQTFLSAAVVLGSRPEFVGYLPAAKRIAVAQQHPTGRMTFVPVGGGQAKTVTGFELNAHVK